MAQSKEFVDASHALNDLSHALALLESENASLRGAVDGLCNENVKLRELVRWMYDRMDESCAVQHPYAPAPISYDLLMQALARVRELGIEVDG